MIRSPPLWRSNRPANRIVAGSEPSGRQRSAWGIGRIGGGDHLGVLKRQAVMRKRVRSSTSIDEDVTAEGPADGRPLAAARPAIGTERSRAAADRHPVDEPGALEPHRDRDVNGLPQPVPPCHSSPRSPGPRSPSRRRPGRSTPPGRGRRGGRSVPPAQMQTEGQSAPRGAERAAQADGPIEDADPIAPVTGGCLCGRGWSRGGPHSSPSARPATYVTTPLGHESGGHSGVNSPIESGRAVVRITPRGRRDAASRRVRTICARNAARNPPSRWSPHEFELPALSRRSAPGPKWRKKLWHRFAVIHGGSSQEVAPCVVENLVPLRSLP